MSVAKGFTILELLVVIFVIAVVGFALTNNLVIFYFTSLRDEEVGELISTLNLAQSKSLSGAGDMQYKVAFGSNAYTLVDEGGLVLMSRTLHEAVTLESTVNEIEFEKITGKTNSCSPTCSIIIGLAKYPGQKFIDVSSEGVIDAYDQP